MFQILAVPFYVIAGLVALAIIILLGAGLKLLIGVILQALSRLVFIYLGIMLMLVVGWGLANLLSLFAP